jgi:hypothetical protein
MRSSLGATALAVLVATLLPNCAASQVQAGFANAPGLGRSVEDGRAYDVVANGSDSCPRKGSGQADPVSHRMVSCEGLQPIRSTNVRFLAMPATPR